MGKDVTTARAEPEYRSKKEAESTETFRREIETVFTRYADAFNAGDASLAASFLAPNPIAINSTGIALGEQRLWERLQIETKSNWKMAVKLLAVQPVGSGGAWAVGSFTATLPNPGGPTQHSHGHWTTVFERLAGEWKVRVVSFARSAAPPPASGG
jgi:ketosteroid isomerase-like protein